MPTLRLVEALPKMEGVSEVSVLDEALRVLGRGADQRLARHVRILADYPETKSEFLASIQRPCDYLHVSAHGRQDGEEGRIFIRNGAVTACDLGKVGIKARTVFINACGALSDDLVRAFINATELKPAHYIAPEGETWFDDALLVALLFWKAVLFDGRRPAIALRVQHQIKGLRARYYWDAW